MNAFQQGSVALGGSPVGNPNFSMGQNTLSAQQALQRALMAYQGTQAGIGRQFQQQDFNSQMQPGILGYLGLGATALGAGADVVNGFNRNDAYKRAMIGTVGSPYAGPPNYLSNRGY